MALNISFLIGNGFDIGLGLPTRYEDFYKCYCKKDEKDNDNIKNFKEFLLKRNDDEIKKIIDWADFEKAYGEHSVAMDDPQKYLERFEDFVEKFNQYLELIEKNVNYSNEEEIAEVMFNAVNHFGNIRKADKDLIDKFCRKFGSDRKYSFVTFNYTRTIDRCVDLFRKKVKSTASIQIDRVLHIHGYIDENMIVGVNDPSQILNEIFANSQEIVEELVKPQQNELSRTGYEEELTSIVNSSNIICIYGMSIGETDRKWWEYIAKWLSQGDNKILVILIHDSRYNRRFPHSQQQMIKSVLGRFLGFSNVSKSVMEKIEKRIYIGFNNDVFGMKLYQQDAGNLDDKKYTFDEEDEIFFEEGWDKDEFEHLL